MNRKEGNVLFNDALNTFYLRLCGVRHMVTDYCDSEKGNPLPPHGLLFPISSKGFFYMHHPTDRIARTTAFVTPVVKHWLEREIAQWVHSMKDQSDDPSHHERTLLPRSYISLLEREIAQWVHSMKDRSDDPLHHERTLLPRSYISLRILNMSLIIYTNLNHRRPLLL